MRSRKKDRNVFKKDKKVSFASKDIQQQAFPFSYSTMNYICKNADAEIFKKFNESCKYFFAKYNYNIIDVLRFILLVPPPPTFDYYDFNTYGEESFNRFSKNLWISEDLILSDATLNFYQTFFPKIVRCDILYFTLSYSEDFPFDDFKKITEAGKVKNLEITDNKIIHSDGSTVPLEEIYACVPNVTELRMRPTHVNSQTMQKLNSKKHLRQEPFININLWDISDALNAEEVYEFVKDNFDEMDFGNNFTFDFDNSQYTKKFEENFEQIFSSESKSN